MYAYTYVCTYIRTSPPQQQLKSLFRIVLVFQLTPISLFVTKFVLFFCRLLLCPAEGDFSSRKDVPHSELSLFLCQHFHLGDIGEVGDGGTVVRLGVV